MDICFQCNALHTNSIALVAVYYSLDDGIIEICGVMVKPARYADRERSWVSDPWCTGWMVRAELE